MSGELTLERQFLASGETRESLEAHSASSVGYQKSDKILEGKTPPGLSTDNYVFSLAVIFMKTTQ